MTNETTTQESEAARPSKEAGWTGSLSKLPPARRWFTYALLVLLGFSLGCSEFVVIGIEPELAEAFDCSLAQVGDLISFFALAYAIATPLLEPIPSLTPIHHLPDNLRHMQLGFHDRKRIWRAARIARHHGRGIRGIACSRNDLHS